jgi:hypothetical protein
LTLDISVGRAGLRGAVELDKVVITPEARNATKRYLARSFTDSVLDGKTGKIKTVRAEKWIKNNEAVLDQFPNLKAPMTNALQAQELATKTRVDMDIRKQAIRNPKISAAAVHLDAADLDMVIEKLFKSSTPIRVVKEMVRRARKDPTGDALEGLKGGIIDKILNISSTGGFNEAGEQTLSGHAILSFLKKEKNTLYEVFTPEQLKRMRVIGNELAKIEIFERIPRGKPDINMEDWASNALKMFSRVSGARVGRWVSRWGGGGTDIQTPGIFSDRFRSLANHLNFDRATQLIQDAILSKNPNLLQALLAPINKPTTRAGQRSLRILDQRINAWLAGTGKRVMDDILQEKEVRQ